MDCRHSVCTVLCFLIGAGDVTCGTVKRTPWFTFTHAQKKLGKEKREHVDEIWVRCCKVNKLKVMKDSGAAINAYCCRNDNGSCMLGLDFHLESNTTN